MTVPDDWLRAANSDRRVGARVEFHATIGSTNDRARELLALGANEGVAVVADFQSVGRGRLGRSWQSPPGRNLMVSVPLALSLPAPMAWRLAAASALAVRDACLPHAVLGVKWPNDLVAADGRKVAGLLVETTLRGETVASAVVGMGVNVNWGRSEMPAGLAERATSLSELCSARVDRVALLGRLLDALDERVASAERGESPIAAYRAASWLDGRLARVRTGEGVVEGRVAGIGDDGALLVDTGAGIAEVAYGEVEAVELQPTVAA